MAPANAATTRGSLVAGDSRALRDADGAVVARRRVDVVYTVDERATDGFYLVRSAQILQGMFDDPDVLTRPPG